MISSLRGSVLHASADAVVIDVGGVGFQVAVPPEVARGARTGEGIVLHTSLIVREDALSLFGFADREQLEVFTALLSVSGVGPKSALGVLAALTVDEIAAAVEADDDKPFRAVSGIGPKTAKLIVVQLAGKLAPPSPATPPRGAAAAPRGVADQVVAALVGLGWPERQAAEAVDSVLAADPPAAASVPGVLRLALAHLGPARAGAGS